MENMCVCKDCEKRCNCDLHNTYQSQEVDGCNHGENPINYCDMKETAIKE